MQKQTPSRRVFQIVRYSYALKRSEVLKIINEKFTVLNELEALVVDYIREQDGAAKVAQPIKSFLFDYQKFISVKDKLPLGHYITRNVDDHVYKYTVWRKYDKKVVSVGRYWNSTYHDIQCVKVYDFEITEISSSFLFEFPEVLYTANDMEMPDCGHPLADIVSKAKFWNQLQTLVNDKKEWKLTELRKLPNPIPVPPPLPPVAALGPLPEVPSSTPPELVKEVLDLQQSPATDSPAASPSPVSSIKKNAYREEVEMAKCRAANIAVAAAAKGAELISKRRTSDAEDVQSS